MKRRTFLNAMSMVPLTFLIPMPLMPAPSAMVASQNPEHQAIWAKIHELEAQLRLHRGFHWGLHNDLRHYYGAVDEYKSLMHADIILKHSVMDTYILNTLSDWHYDREAQTRDPRLAVTSLLRRVDLYPTLRFLQAASVIKVGEIASDVGRSDIASRVYQRVADELRTRTTHTLMAYRHIAQSRMATFNTGIA